MGKRDMATKLKKENNELKNNEGFFFKNFKVEDHIITVKNLR